MEMGLTAKELAQRASVTPGYISQIEHDQIKPSMNVMMRIAEVLNVPMAALLMAGAGTRGDRGHAAQCPHKDQICRREHRV